MTEDDAATYVANAPEYLAPSANLTMDPQGALQAQYMDNQPYDVMTAEAETKLTLEVSGLALAQLAQITGRTFEPRPGACTITAVTRPSWPWVSGR